MKVRSLFGLVALTVAMSSCQTQTINREKESLTPITFEKVALEDNFWLPRLKTQKETLVPYSLGKIEHAVKNLQNVIDYRNGKKVEGKFQGPYFVASDLFKVMEGAAYLLILEKDEKLEAQMDEIIDIIAESQDEDGYLYERHMLPDYMNNADSWRAGTARYNNVVHSHELYNMGHMYEGAVAYYRATGKRKWLDVAEKNAQHINKVFFEGDPNYNGGKPVMQAPGHEEIELALIKLAQATGNKLYSEMAKKFIDIRGVTYCPTGKGVMAPSYAQQHLPVREQRTAEGHAVRAMYLYSSMADVVAELGDTTLNPALDAIWHDVMDKKIHINGGLGAVPGIEGFGPEYVLPNKDTYDETCAAVGNVFFNYRMFLASGDAKYVDAAEISLYNNVLAGVNIEGNKFFYVNVLEADGRKAFNHGRAGRSPWFGTSCCPSNMARLIPQISGMVYSHTEDDIYCALYAGSSTVVPLAAGDVKLKQTTAYPFEGKISIEVEPAVEGEEFTLWLRIPTWCGEQFIPGKLYSYADNNRSKVVAKINGERVRTTVVDGYMPVQRAWKAGDKVELELPMPVRYSVADERVEADLNRVCLTRGPLLYCAEQPDNEYPASHYVVRKIGKQGEMSVFSEGILNGITYVNMPAEVVVDGEATDATLKLIPYYAWNNRGDNITMNVWFARDAETVLESIPHVVGNVKSVKASYTCENDNVMAVADGKQPSNSGDGSIPRWTSWLERGKAQWVELELKKTQPIESVSVYWYDDKGSVRIPESWNLEYRIGGEWKPWVLYNTDSYNLFADQYNMVHPAEPIKADAIRINMQPKENVTVGILEVVIE